MTRRVQPVDVEKLASEWKFEMGPEALSEFETLTGFILETLETIDDLPQPPAYRAEADRDPGRPPTEGEDPYNAIVRWCRVRQEGAEGLLSGYKIGIKDSVSVADVPLTVGSDALDYVPARDSVVARRIIEAGGEIVAMLNMDYFAFSGGGDSSGHGSTLCPFDTSRTAGGSSGGSGAALFYDDVDITVGCDQGGSIRAPAAWCGVVGLKPTYGLVPYEGIVPIDFPIDHTGPMARTTADAARLLTVMAGKHPTDPRQPAEVPSIDYLSVVEKAGDDLRGLRVGVVIEGCGEGVGADERNVAAARGAIERLSSLGAEVRDVSVPEHLQAGGISFAGFIEGIAAVIEGGGNGFGWNGVYTPELSAAFAKALDKSNKFSNQIKLALLCGTHLRREMGGEFYARAHNLHGWLTAGYDRLLDDVDVLVMPTTPGLPHLDDPSLSISEKVLRGWALLANTGPFDFTGHPAISIPAAEVDGLPAGLMMVSRHFEDDRLLSIAQTYEQAFGWAPEGPEDPRSARWSGSPTAPPKGR